MGYRTVVVLFNDQCSEWEKDTDLGRKIAHGMNDVVDHRKPDQVWGRNNLGYGRVVECTHADTQTLAVVDSYHFTPIVHGFWQQNQTHAEIQLKLVKAAADHLGYRLVKKS